MFNNTNYQGKGIQTITSLMSIRMATDKNKETHFGKDVEKREPLGTVGGNVNWYSLYAEQYEYSFSEKAMATLSSTLAWKIPWMEESGRLQSMGSLRVSHD